MYEICTVLLPVIYCLIYYTQFEMSPLVGALKCPQQRGTLLTLLSMYAQYVESDSVCWYPVWSHLQLSPQTETQMACTVKEAMSLLTPVFDPPCSSSRTCHGSAVEGTQVPVMWRVCAMVEWFIHSVIHMVMTHSLWFYYILPLAKFSRAVRQNHADTSVIQSQ